MRCVKAQKAAIRSSKIELLDGHETSLRLSDIPLGGRLLFRSRKDWRTAVVSSISTDKITISVSSPKGRSYRIRRDPDAAVFTNGAFFLLDYEHLDSWNENLASYDARW